MVSEIAENFKKISKISELRVGTLIAPPIVLMDMPEIRRTHLSIKGGIMASKRKEQTSSKSSSEEKLSIVTKASSEEKLSAAAQTSSEEKASAASAEAERPVGFIKKYTEKFGSSLSQLKRPAGFMKKHTEKFGPSLSQFLRVLFDFSFQEFITTRLIKLIYVMGVIIGLVLAFFGIVQAFQESFIVGIMILIVSPIAFLINVILLRVVLELIMVMFHIGENLEALSQKSESAE